MLTKSDIAKKLEHLEALVPCGTHVLLMYGVESLHDVDVLSIKSTESIIDINFRGKDYEIVPLFVPTINDETILLSKYNPE